MPHGYSDNISANRNHLDELHPERPIVPNIVPYYGAAKL